MVPLPPLSRLSIESTPANAKITVYSVPEEQHEAVKLHLGEIPYTPAQIPLKHGTYQIRVQKSGFFVPEAKEAAIIQYDTVYPVEPFQLRPIKVIGKTEVISNSGEALSVEEEKLTLQVRQDAREIYRETLSTDGSFRFEPTVHEWLKVDSAYELNVTGQAMLSVEPVSFVYEGYTDIHSTVQVTLDKIPPVLLPNGITFENTRLVVGEEVKGFVKTQDDGLGVVDTIEILFQPPNRQETLSITASLVSIPENISILHQNLRELMEQAMPPGSREQIREQITKWDENDFGNLDKLISEFLPSVVKEQMESGKWKMNAEDLQNRMLELYGPNPLSNYQFSFVLPEEPSTVGEWHVATLTLQDKAGNKTPVSEDQLNATFLVFPERIALAKKYFDERNYSEALLQLKKTSSPNDDVHYLSALSYYHQGEVVQGLATFQKIKVKTDYLGTNRKEDMPKMPRKMANKIWGKLLDNLDTHREDAEYIILIAATAEELDRSYEAKVYRDYAKSLGEMLE
jgi:hypothetical protein